MRQVTGSMTNVVKGMDHAMKTMDLEKVLPPTSVSRSKSRIRLSLSMVGSVD